MGTFGGRMITYTVGEFAKKVHRTVTTVQRWDRAGTLVAARTHTGRRYYTEADLRKVQGLPLESKKKVAYCRVSSQAQKPDLLNQRRILEEYCAAKGLDGVEFVEEIGGGLNFKRKRFLSLIDEIIRGEVSHVVLAHKDRIMRFGFELFLHLCSTQGCTVLILNAATLSPQEEMVQDLMTIIHCFSSRLYGLRNYRRDLKKALINDSRA